MERKDTLRFRKYLSTESGLPIYVFFEGETAFVHSPLVDCERYPANEFLADVEKNLFVPFDEHAYIFRKDRTFKVIKVLKKTTMDTPVAHLICQLEGEPNLMFEIKTTMGLNFRPEEGTKFRMIVRFAAVILEQDKFYRPKPRGTVRYMKIISTEDVVSILL